MPKHFSTDPLSFRRQLARASQDVALCVGENSLLMYADEEPHEGVLVFGRHVPQQLHVPGFGSVTLPEARAHWANALAPTCRCKIRRSQFCVPLQATRVLHEVHEEGEREEEQ